MQRTAGLEDVHFLKPDDVKHLFPYVDSESIQGATWCSSDGFLRPGVIYGEAANAAQRLGVNIIPKCPNQQGARSKMTSFMKSERAAHGCRQTYSLTAQMLGLPDWPHCLAPKCFQLSL